MERRKSPDFCNDGHSAVRRLAIVRGFAIALAIALPIGQTAAGWLLWIWWPLCCPGV